MIKGEKRKWSANRKDVQVMHNLSFEESQDTLGISVEALIFLMFTTFIIYAFALISACLGKI